MNTYQRQGLSLFSENTFPFMSPATLYQFSIEIGGMKRKRTCREHKLLSLCVWINQQIATTSLTQIYSQLKT